jgi:very-short-patch-repair endonuclease
LKIDGATHRLSKSKIHDEEREKYFKSFGITVLRFENERIYNDLFIVVEEIKHEIKALKWITTPKSPP